MPKRLTVVLSQGQSANPAKRKLEEDIVARLIIKGGVDVTVIGHLYDLAPDGTGMLCLQGIEGDMAVLSWLFPRAARWTLDRQGIRGHEGHTLLVPPDDDELDEDEAEGTADELTGDEKQRVADQRETPNRKIYCLDLRLKDTAEPYIEEIRRIAAEATTKTVPLLDWIGGSPKPEQLDRYLNSAKGNGADRAIEATGVQSSSETADPTEASMSAEKTAVSSTAPTVIAENPARRWYPVIDYSRCTNCLECIDFCLFGVYGMDRVDTILVEQPDNCRKGCPACSRVCPENAIIFPQHKTPAIAGSAEALGGLKIDLSQLFGGDAKDPIATAAAERDEQLVLAGRDAVGLSVGMPKRQSGKQTAPKDELDGLIDALDDLGL